MGRMQALRASRDPDRGIVWSEYLDELAERGPEQRRWELELLGEDSYAERLFVRGGEGWRLLTEWVVRDSEIGSPLT
jgi:hypothetical protein